MDRPFMDADIKQLEGILRKNENKRVVLAQLREELGFRRSARAKQLLKEVLALLDGTVPVKLKSMRAAKPEDQIELLADKPRKKS